MKQQSKKASEQESAPRRRPYEPPAIVETSEFETLALACALADAYCVDILGGPLQNS